MNARGRNARRAEEVRFHELTVAARVRAVEADELIQIERPHLRQVTLAAYDEVAELVIQANRCAARRQAEHHRWLRCNRVRKTTRQRSRGHPIVRKNGDAEMSVESHQWR